MQTTLPFRVILAGLLLVGFGQGALPGADAVDALKEAPVNRWVVVEQSKTGWRESPVFVYVPTIKKIVMASGMQSEGGLVARHYDTEEFDPATLQWTNAYPASVAEGRPRFGPVGEEYAKARINQGNNGPVLFYKDSEHLRPGAGGQWLTTKLDYEFACVPDTGIVYAYLHDKTLRYDPVKRTWQDTGAKPRPACRIWGSLCYDPINNELLHTGGDGGSADVGTFAYSLAKNEWRRLEFGSPRLKQLHTEAKALRWQAKALLGACTNRFAVSETAAEAKADLKEQASRLATRSKKLLAAVEAGPFAEHEKAGGKMAGVRLQAVLRGLAEVGPKLGERIDAAGVASVRAIRVLCEQVVDALAAEPPGRARSQTVYDPVHRKIVLFGGDGLDRVLSDTWVYDCRTRVWEQKFPERCPAPRAGHVLGWLPKGKQVVLAGGYSRDWLAQEIWIYDVGANEWKMLLHVPLETREYGRVKVSPNSPTVSSRTNQVGAVTEDDRLFCISSVRPGLVTRVCKIDVGAVDTAGTARQAARSGSYTFNRIDPARWEEAAKSEGEKGTRFLEALPTNQWTAFPFPMYAPGATNRWGTTAYDPDRQQLLFWGGGHATSQENDVAHFSVRGGFWTVGYHPDDPIEIIYASVPTPLSFHDRVHVPIHAYKAYCYDPAAGKMFYFDRAYDPAVREWEPKAYPGLEHRGPMNSFMVGSPKGAFTYSSKGLFRFDAAEKKWRKLPWNGPEFGSIWCDGHALVYDSKRDCLWLTNEKAIFRYDIASGKAVKLEGKKPAALGQFLFWGEQVYLPEEDLILLMRLVKRPDGTFRNVVWDPATNKFYWARLKFVENGKEVTFKNEPFSWSDALHYDPKLKRVLLNNSSARKVWALKFDRASANLEEMPDK